VCGKGDWCSRSSDGVWTACRRVDTGHGLHRVDKAGVDYWLYSAGGLSYTDRPTADSPTARPPDRAPHDTLDAVYRAFLASLPLAPRHRQNLHKRGLSDGEINRRQYRMLPPWRRADLACHLVNSFGPAVCAQVPGLYIKAVGGRQWWSVAGTPGLLIPVSDSQGRIIALVIRGDDAAATARYSCLSSKRFGAPGPGAHDHVPLFDGPASPLVRLTEGPLKVDVATTLSGVLTVGLPGATSWRQALPLLATLQPRTVALAFDADARRNEAVASALHAAARALQQAGFAVVLERWAPSHGKGIDDVFAAGHRPEVLAGKTMQQAIQSIVCAAHLARPGPEAMPTKPQAAPRDWQVARARARQQAAEETARHLLASRRGEA
jgi:hypothetical protein